MSSSNDLPNLRPPGTAVLAAPGDDLARYERPARGAAGRAAAVARPGDVAELRELVRWAVHHRVRLLPQGANTGLVGASVPTPDGDTVVLSTERLAGVEELSGTDATAMVLAGTRLSELNTRAGGLGLHLPVDLAADPTIGGMVATNTGGSRVLRYGPMRAHVLGVEAVLADRDATVLGPAGRLRKDSRGLDLAQLLVGSGGTLGIVTRVALALTAVPARVETWWLTLDRPEDVPEVFDRLRARRPGSLSAFEFVGRAALALTLAGPEAPPHPFGAAAPAAALLVEWSADDHRALDGLEDDLAAVAATGAVTDAHRLPAADAWAIRHRVSDSLRAAGTVLGHDVSTPRDRLFAARAEAIEALGAVAPDAQVCDFGHVGDGGLHLNLVVPPGGDTSPARRAAVRDVIDRVVAAHGGSYSAEHGLGPLNAARWFAATPLAEQRLVAALKAAADPAGILGHPDHPYNRLVPRTA